MKTQRWSKEQQRLLTYLNPSIDLEESSKTIRLQQDIDWQQFMLLSHQHKITPLIYQHLFRYPYLAPDEVFTTCKAYCHQNTQRSLKMTAELLTITRLFNKEKIRNIALKGPVLSYQLYGKLGMRVSCDIDILISSQQIMRAHAILLNRGYVCFDPSITLSTKQLHFYIKHKKHFAYRRLDSDYYLELHWRLFDDRQLLALDIDEIGDSLISIPIANTAITCLPPEINLLYLLTHGSQHVWLHFSLLYDIKQYIKMHRELNWGKIMQWADRFKITTQVNEGLLLANKLLGANLPEAVLSKIESNKKTKALCQLTTQIIHSQNHQPIKCILLKMIREYQFYTGSFRRQFNAVPVDWEIIKLPDQLFFMYFLFRPFLWIFRKLMKRVKQDIQ